MSLEDDSVLPVCYREEIARMLDDMEGRIIARLTMELSAHEMQHHGSADEDDDEMAPLY